jgi:hypothetical protein
MSNRMNVAKITAAMVRFEKTFNYVVEKIDKRSQNGKINEDEVNNHLTNIDEDGSRCWSF